MRKLTAVFLLMICRPTLSFPWGVEGHQVIADIARGHLTETTRQHVRELLGTDDLASIAIWADDVRSQRPETFGWHFVDIPMNSSGFLESRDCYRPNEKHPESLEDHHNCVVDRISMFQSVLADGNLPASKRVEALKFLVHFVGDLHQPLHAMDEARGGNDIHVVEFGSSQCGTRLCNLHLVWDVGLIEHSGRNEAAYVAYAETQISQQKLQNRAHGSPAEWANESFKLAHQVWLNQGGQADEAYYKKNIEIVDERLALGGLRLAALLNQCLGK